MGGKTGKKEVEDLDIGFARAAVTHFCDKAAVAVLWTQMRDSLVGWCRSYECVV